MKINPWVTRRAPRAGSGTSPSLPKSTCSSTPGVAVDHRHRRPTATEAQLGDREPVQRPIRHRHAAPLEQHMHLGQRQALLEPGADLLAVAGDGLPRGPGAPGSGRAHRGHHRPQQLIAELAGATVAVQPGGPACLDIAADRLAVHRRQRRHFPQRPTIQPQPQDLFHLDHGHLPVGHTDDHTGRTTHQDGATPGWSHHWQTGGPMRVAELHLSRSHARGRRQTRPVSEPWQAAL